MHGFSKGDGFATTVFATRSDGQAASQPPLFTMQASQAIWDVSGRYLAVASDVTHGVSVHHGMSGALLASYELHDLAVSSMRWLPDAQNVVSSIKQPAVQMNGSNTLQVYYTTPNTWTVLTFAEPS